MTWSKMWMHVAINSRKTPMCMSHWKWWVPALHDADHAGPYWCLADNLLNGALIFGDEIPRWRSREVTVRADGAILDQRVASPPLDDLFHCLPWWIAQPVRITSAMPAK